MIASTANEVMPSHGACKLALPCAKSSPSEGEPGGSPKPRKSSEVNVVIETQSRRHVAAIVAALIAAGFPTELLSAHSDRLPPTSP